MSRHHDKLICRCLHKILLSVVRFCLRHSLRIQDLTEAAKAAFIEAAKREIERNGDEVNVSRLSVMTGLHRRDVMRIYHDEDAKIEPGGLVTRVIGQWQSDPRFTTKSKKPKVLDFGGKESDFDRLVRLVSNDVHSGTVLFELERVKAVKRTGRGLKLMTQGYTVREDVEKSFDVLGLDMEDLCQAVEENVFQQQGEANLHIRTEYDRIREDALPSIRKWLLEQGAQFHRRAREYLAKYDLDIHPDASYEGKAGRAVVGSFSRVEEPGDNLPL